MKEKFVIKEKNRNSKYLWYVGYGSNLFRERFICYISGGQFQLGGKHARGCRDKTLPKENKPFIITHSLFFARNAPSWGNGGVAFISPERDESNHTYGKMWKITREQFSDIWEQEGQRWYDKELNLGQDNDGIPIVTITSSDKLESNTPSDKYLKTMAMGLEETCHMDKKTISKYLIEKPGIKGSLTEERLLEIIDSD